MIHKLKTGKISKFNLVNWWNIEPGLIMKIDFDFIRFQVV